MTAKEKSRIECIAGDIISDAHNDGLSIEILLTLHDEPDRSLLQAEIDSRTSWTPGKWMHMRRGKVYIHGQHGKNNK